MAMLIVLFLSLSISLSLSSPPHCAVGNGNAPYNQSKLFHNEWLTAANGGTMGPEFGIAGTTPGKNVMLMKSCIGNRALGWDLLPPGTPRHDFTDSKGDVYTCVKEEKNRRESVVLCVCVNSPL